MTADCEQINKRSNTFCSAGAERRGREDIDLMIRERVQLPSVITRFGLKSNKDQSHIHEIVNVIVTSSHTYTAHHTLVTRLHTRA